MMSNGTFAKSTESCSSESPALTIFADGLCPLCIMEMKRLKQKDIHNRIQMVDIHSDIFSEQYPEIEKQKAMNVLHGKLGSGEVLTGLDVTHYAWILVGSGCFTRLLRCRITKPGADRLYLFFAKHRYKFSKLLTGKSRLPECSTCQNKW